MAISALVAEQSMARRRTSSRSPTAGSTEPPCLGRAAPSHLPRSTPPMGTGCPHWLQSPRQGAGQGLWPLRPSPYPLPRRLRGSSSSGLGRAVSLRQLTACMPAQSPLLHLLQGRQPRRTLAGSQLPCPLLCHSGAGTSPPMRGRTQSPALRCRRRSRRQTAAAAAHGRKAAALRSRMGSTQNPKGGRPPLLLQQGSSSHGAIRRSAGARPRLIPR